MLVHAGITSLLLVKSLVGGGSFFLLTEIHFLEKKKINLCQEWYNADEYSI